MIKGSRPALLSLLLVTLSSTAGVCFAGSSTTARVSIDSNGVQGNKQSWYSAISADGRFVAFHSDATNLVAGDTNGTWDVFVRDRQTNQTQRVSIDSGGVQGNNSSRYADISADGRYVAFYSYASNLVVGDTNGTTDIFVHDRQTGVTERVSIDSGGVQGNGNSYGPSINADGRYVAYQSSASNLVAGDTNGAQDIFVHDRQTNQTQRVSIDSSGVQGNFASFSPAISTDGRYVAFPSFATNLVAGDSNGTWDVFVHDRQTNQTQRVSIDSGGVQGNNSSRYADISADGRYVAFSSFATNLVAGDTNGTWDVFVHDRQTNQTQRVSIDSNGVQGNSISWVPAISAGGRYVAFHSGASNLVAGDSNGTYDAFVHDRQTNQTERVSIDSGGVEGDSWSQNPAISADGRYVAFDSLASNLVAGDSNNTLDVFVHDRQGVVNQPPSANAGPDQTVECSGSATSVILDGSGSSDPDGDALTYTWSGPFGTASGVAPTVGLALGASPITLSVDDGNGGTDSDSVNVTVQDTVAPVVAAGHDVVIEAKSPEGAPYTVHPEASDACSAVSLAISPTPHVYPPGLTEVTVTGTDGSGNTASDPLLILVLPWDRP